MEPLVLYDPNPWFMPRFETPAPNDRVREEVKAVRVKRGARARRNNATAQKRERGMEEFEAFLAESVGRALRQAREARAWPQARLADAVDATVEYVSLLERGARLPSVSMLCRFSLALEVSVARLLGEEPATSNPDEGAALLRAVPENARPAVLGILRALVAPGRGT